MIKFLDKFIDSNEKQVNQLKPLVEKINSLEEEVKKLKKKDFLAKTANFRERLKEGETGDEVIAEAFALAREAGRRAIGMRQYDVQLMTAISLYYGKIVEQKTGEGKTLSAVPALYLRSLMGQGTHLITVNDYLARRDAGWMGPIFHLLGVSTACIIHEQAFLYEPEYEDKSATDWRLSHLKPIERKEAYQADITYGTNNEFGFDYLRDNLVTNLDDAVQRKHYYAIVDEVDSILIDEARTPLIISAPDTEPTDKYYQFAKLIDRLSGDTDYTIDEKSKTANLTEHGIKKVEKMLGVENLYEKEFETIHHTENALRARTLFHRDKDYVIKEGQVIIVDEFTGRLMFGRRWSEGMHQAVEAKEGVAIQRESRTLATISFQNYFRMYQVLAGMTGTAATEAEEFHKIYNLEVVVIPTNEPMIRKNHPDVVYKTARAKYAAVVREIEECHRKGQPVLVGTTSIEKNEIIDKFLKKKGIPHNILNAKQHEKEALVIAEAGGKGAVTVATNMAGRGVDIVLGGKRLEPWEVEDKKEWEKLEKEWKEKHEEVIKSGGLHVVGTERHESRRIDNQLRGRSGRQGDPGSSRFFVSLEDDIMRIFGGEQVSKLMTMFKLPEDQPLEHKMVSKAIEQAQVKVEGFNFDARKHLVEYDDVLNKQREIIYGIREKVLGGEKMKEEILGKIEEEIKNMVLMYSPEGYTEPEYESIIRGFCEIVPFDDASQKQLITQISRLRPASGQGSGGQANLPEKIEEFLFKIVTDLYENREKQVEEKTAREIEKFAYLSSIDHLWMGHLDSLDHLREGVGLRGYGQRDPLVEYKNEAFQMFDRLVKQIDYEIIRRIFRIQVARRPTSAPPVDGATAGKPVSPPPRDIKTNIDTSDMTGLAQPTSAPPAHRTLGEGGPPKQKKIGRNDPCPCGAMRADGKPKKYKHCCYPKFG